MLMRIMGVVMKALNNHEYIIYFLQTKEEMIFNHAKLRPHLEFIDNKWVEASKVCTLLLFFHFTGIGSVFLMNEKIFSLGLVLKWIKCF